MACYAAKDGEFDLIKDEKSNDCTCGNGGNSPIDGGNSAIDVYRIESFKDSDFEHKGCWRDKANPRALPKLVASDGWGMTPTKCFELVLNENKLIEDINQGSYTVFGVQVRII